MRRSGFMLPSATRKETTAISTERSIPSRQAAASGDGYANSFVQLGIGICLYDLGRCEENTDPLLRAYMGGGEENF